MPNNVMFKFEIPNSTVVLLLDFSTTLHRKKPPVKTLISIGYGGANPQQFARMASEAKSRKSQGAHAALYDPKGNISTSCGLKSWIRAGMPWHMVVMGLPLYGRTWKLKDPNLNEIGAPVVGLGPGDEGVLNFAEVVKFNEENGATVVYDVETVSTYSYVGSSCIGYDDTLSTLLK
ncbi:hypothetical protein GH714_005562 [Hevea brasiliensis]|uniref:GH18 domain-containing protein n=1 Tax=Hevea brasiliensis TaxID=3981 RepID=A0A6A6MCG3_HEVBR|nr:hypothetical protein GH714_005562 [Hevea brasiliensis]